MGLVSDQLPNLMNGVSQQAVTMRLKSQATEQINGFSSIVEGNIKRMPTKHIAKVMDSTSVNALTHTINRDVNERYIVVIENRSIRVFTLDGQERSVAYPDGTDYIASVSPQDDIRAITVADYTFIVNNKIEVKALPDTSPPRGKDGLLFLKNVEYSREYKVFIDGELVAQHDTPDASTGTAITVEAAIQDLYAQLIAAGGPVGYTFRAKDPVIYVAKDDGADFTLEFDDNSGNNSLAIHKRVTNFTDLPVAGRAGMVVEVTGDDTSDADSYYLKFVSDGLDTRFLNLGYWEETIAPDTQSKLDNTTMPHSLVRLADGSFELRKIDWGERVVGDLDSAPWPSFVNSKINDIYLDRNRLCFLSANNVIMSQARSLFNFFRETVTTLLDDAPIDVSATTTKVATLNHAVPFNGRILLFSDQTQFEIKDEKLIASAPPWVRPITDYESDLKASPEGSGRTLYFPVVKGQHAGLMEYYVLEESDATDATDVTDHVPTYIEGGFTQLSASPTADIVLATASAEKNVIYPYKFHWKASQKVQSSWSKWVFGAYAKIISIGFIKSVCYILVEHPDGVYLESLDLSEGQTDAGEEFVYRLDRRVTEAGVGMVYTPATKRTTLTLPYAPEPDTFRVVTRNGNGASNRVAGTTIDVVSVNGNDVEVKGDVTNTQFFAGEVYAHVYEFSEQVMKAPSQTGGLATIAAGRLQLHRWHVHFADSGYFRAEVTPKGQFQPYVYQFTGIRLGTDEATIGTIPITSGTFAFRVNSRPDRVSIKLINDSFLPSAFTAAEWEGRFERRTSRP